MAPISYHADMHRHCLAIVASLLTLFMVSCGGGGGAAGAGGPQDVVAPTATVVLSPGAVPAGANLTASVIFSEEVTGITAGDLVVAGGTVIGFSIVDARTYTYTITAGGAGTTTVDAELVAGAGQDSSGNVSMMANGQAAVAYAPWASASGSDTYGFWAELTVTGNGETAVQRFRLMAPGTFAMGSPVHEPGRNWGTLVEYESQHQVTLTAPYWIADSECTQRMWKAVMNTTPSYFAVGGLDLPVERVSHDTVQVFLTTLNLLHANLSARLPTESEWEFAARGGTITPFGVSPVDADSINCTPWSADPYIASGTNRNVTMVVKSLPANPWGLHDMHGNVWEWCSDWWQNDLGTMEIIDPTGPTSGSYRVARGGGFTANAQNCRSAMRNRSEPFGEYLDTGFRLVAPGWPGGSG